jgi:phospholipase/carboxylesterase
MSAKNGVLNMIHRFRAGSSGETLLLLHGTGGNETDLLGLGQELAPNASLLSPRGAVLEQGMPRFFRRIRPGVLDLEDLRVRTNELADFVAAAATEYGFDARRVTALGYSNGANIAASALYLRPEMLQHAVLLRPMQVFPERKASGLSGKSVLLAGGRYDAMSNPADVDALAEALQEGGAQAQVHWSPGGHELHSSDLEAALAFLQSPL